MVRNVNRIGSEYNNFCIISGEPIIGKNTWIGYFCVIDGTGGLEIGKQCSIASGVHIYTHDSIRWALKGVEKDLKTNSHLDRAAVKIGNNVFIGANSVILKGVTIGDRVIIGANTVIRKNVPSDSIVIGNPANIKRRTR